jgi:cytidylate kinase
MIITIDGPPASGKTSLAKQIADEYQILHVSSGDIYRYAAHLECRGKQFRARLINDLERGDDRVLQRISEARGYLRQREVGRVVSEIARDKILRSAVGTFLTSLVKQSDCVFDGRDMSVLFPNATLNLLLRTSRDQQRSACVDNEETFEELIARHEREIVVEHSTSVVRLSVMSCGLPYVMAKVRELLQPSVVSLQGDGTYVGPISRLLVLSSDIPDSGTTASHSVLLVKPGTKIEPHLLMKYAESFDLRYLVNESSNLDHLLSGSRRVRIVTGTTECLMFETNMKCDLLVPPNSSQTAICASLGGVSQQIERGARELFISEANDDFLDQVTNAVGRVDSLVIRWRDTVLNEEERGAARILAETERLQNRIDVITALCPSVLSLGVLVPFVRNANEALDVTSLMRKHFWGRVGLMLEVPLALYQFRRFATVADFYVIGEGDLSAAISGENRANCPDVETLGVIRDLIEVHVLPYLSPGQDLYCTNRRLSEMLQNGSGVCARIVLAGKSLEL